MWMSPGVGQTAGRTETQKHHPVRQKPESLLPEGGRRQEGNPSAVDEESGGCPQGEGQGAPGCPPSEDPPRSLLSSNQGPPGRQNPCHHHWLPVLFARAGPPFVPWLDLSLLCIPYSTLALSLFPPPAALAPCSLGPVLTLLPPLPRPFPHPLLPHSPYISGGIILTQPTFRCFLLFPKCSLQQVVQTRIQSTRLCCVW